MDRLKRAADGGLVYIPDRATVRMMNFGYNM